VGRRGLTRKMLRILNWHRPCSVKNPLRDFNYVKGLPVLATIPDYTLDLRGAIPPITLLKISQVFREMKPQEVLEIYCRDPDTRCDLFKVLPPFTYEVLDIEELADERSTFRVQMKKRQNY